MKIKTEEITKICTDVLLKAGMERKDAELVVDEHLEGELTGRKCHGFQAFPKFAAEKIKSRKGEPKIIRDSGAYTLVDGMGNLGQIVCSRMLPKMIEKSKKNGISMAGIYNMESYLMPGTYARKAAESDMIALIFNYGGRERIAPTGSIDPIFATNPIAVGIPARSTPIVLDMATAAYAMGKVRLALRLDDKIPEGMAVDKNGKPTTDPKEAMDGALLPFGGHKGSGLALVVEILSRCLLDVHKREDQVYRGYFFIIIDPSKFIEMEKFKDNVEKLRDKIKSSRKSQDVDEIFLPGEISENTKQENLKRGYLEIDDRIIEDIKKLL